MEPQIPFLPDEIIVSILLRLPVKSQFRFMFVSKQWRYLLSTPEFIKTHLSLSQESNILALLVSRDPPSSIALHSIQYEKNYSDPHVDLTPLDDTFKYSYPNAKIWSSCNGLLLVSISEKSFFLWNPSIREYVRLSLPIDFGFCKNYILSGIGYDPSLDEYKIVIASPAIHRNMEKAFVYCLEESHPREIKVSFPFRIRQDTPATNVNGVPHWLIKREGSRSAVIIYFDLADEVFVELPQPKYLGEDSGIVKPNLDLAVLGSWVCLVCHKVEHVEVWAMKEYGVVESWTNLFAIPYATETLRTFECLKPLSFTKNGLEILMEIDQKKLVVYNLEDGSCRFVEFSHNDNGFKVAMYVETIVSPRYSKRRIRSGAISH